MAGDGVAVIEVSKLVKVNANLAPTIHREAYSVGFDFRNRTEFAISNAFLSKRSANLEAIAFGEGALCLIVNTHTGEPRRVISKFSAIKKVNGNSVCRVVGVDHSGVVACLDLELIARGVVADNVFVGPVGIGEGAFGSGHIGTSDIDLRLLILAAYDSLAL